MQTQKMYTHSDHHHHQRIISPVMSEHLIDRVLQIGKTLMDLRSKIAKEKELLQRERMMTASMYMLPTSNDYYTLVYSKAEGDKSSRENPENTFYDNSTNKSCKNIINESSLTNSEKNLIERQRQKNVMSKIHAYRQHLKSVEDKCKLELGAVTESICNLKRVTTELNLEINNKDCGFYDEI